MYSIVVFILSVSVTFANCLSKCPDGYQDIGGDGMCLDSSTRSKECYLCNARSKIGANCKDVVVNCVTSCPDGYFATGNQCYGPKSAKCYTCGDEWTAKHGSVNCKDVVPDCVSKCPDGYQDVGGDSCLDSSTRSKECYKCNAEFKVGPNCKDVVADCVSSCPDGYTSYGKECHGPNSAKCYVCGGEWTAQHGHFNCKNIDKDGNIIKVEKKKKKEDNCVKSCPSGYADFGGWCLDEETYFKTCYLCGGEDKIEGPNCKGYSGVDAAEGSLRSLNRALKQALQAALN